MDDLMNLTAQEMRNRSTLETGMLMADKFINRNYLIRLSGYRVLPLDMQYQSTGSIRLFKIEKIVYDKKENVNDKLISVYSALQDVDSSALMILEGTPTGTSMYVGVRSEINAATAGKILEKSFQGNFCGSELKSMVNSEIDQLMKKMVSSPAAGTCKNVSCVTVVPSPRDEDKDKFVQGLEKFADTMQGEIYTALFIATPVSKPNLEMRKRGLEELYSSLTPFLKTSLAYGTNSSESVARGRYTNFADSVNNSISNTTGKNRGQTETSTQGKNSGFGFHGFSSGSSSSYSSGYSTGESWTRAVTTGNSHSTGGGDNETETQTTGDSKTITIEHQNKAVQALTEKIDKQMARISECESFGVWECACYFIAEDIQTSVVAANSYKALVSGENTGVENSFVNVWGIQNIFQTNQILEYMRYGIHPLVEVPGEGNFKSQIVSAANLVSGKELPFIMGIPHKSVSGIHVSSIAEFGRNVFAEGRGKKGRSIPVGKIFHMGRTEEHEIRLDLDSLTSHCFITGSTGSGKSNTTYCILEELAACHIPFLVIEPAKGEYRTAFGGLPGIRIFTTNPRYHRMLQINPFRFDSHIHVLEHLDRLVEIFNACWEMYAAMPAILKNAMERMYLEKGWDLMNSMYLGEGAVRYPTFRDLLKILPKIISSSEYSADTKGDYTGALVTRVASLTNGIMGQVFCGNCDVTDRELFDETCIVDLSRVGSAETKSLIMGILVMKLSEYRAANASGQNLGLRHVTVMEEAHNLLKKSSGSGGNGGADLIGKSVEMISNSIAEMRTYGEGFLIVDQSPTAVDISAIKNTNTKIIMRLPEQEDCKAVGRSVSLNEDQILELSRLGTGIAVIMQNNWLEAVRGRIYPARRQYEKQAVLVPEDGIRTLRGKLIMELLNQYTARSFDENRLLALLKGAPVPEDKAGEYGRSAREIASVMTKRRDSRQFSDSLMSLAGCRNLFDILENELGSIDFSNVTEDDEIQIFVWHKLFLKKLDHYLTMNPGKKKLLSQYLIYSRLLEDGTSKYIIIYNTLFH